MGREGDYHMVRQLQGPDGHIEIGVEVAWLMTYQLRIETA